MPTIPEYSVVIPTLNEEVNIQNLITDLQKQTFQPKEIIIVDGGSTDNTRKIIKLIPNICLYNKKPNIGQQRNTGWQKSVSDIVVFLDADTRCSPTFIKDSLNDFTEKELDIACPIYDPITKDRRIKKIYQFFNGLFYLAQWVLPSGAGSCIVATKKILRHTDGFKEDYTYDDIYFIRKAAHFGKFRILSTKIHVSPRRFEKYGIWQTLTTYILLSFCFIFGAYNLADKISYPFGTYSKH
ncbi:glycosyltransferase [Candidatus Woesebacteria bacterium]|nr:glycosyltransferase [Candidatus Woesebacteria bacterium]